MTDEKSELPRSLCMVTEMRSQGHEFFLNSENEPTVRVPTDAFQQDWPADSQRITDLMVLIHHELMERVPNRQELSLALAILREECRNGGRRLSQDEVAQRDSEPIVQALHEFTSSNGEYRGRTAVLLTMLRELHRNRCEHLGPDITPFVHVFSRKLGRLITTLRGYGIDVSIDHQEDGSYCTTRKLNNFKMEVTDASASIASASNDLAGKDLPPPDDTDGNIRIEPTQTNECDSDDSGVEGGSE